MTVLLNIALAFGIAVVALSIFGCACSLVRRVRLAIELRNLRNHVDGSDTVA
ncbi:hypothetical protein [Sphingomonas sp. Leaf23]|uniref:hypothetical protein n=1 Tax=Sphingomonas sp. Leaf23 TaxID=1735689 RepID=UPI000B22B699|nr:hypothetical protein [Sphingomonas sp. Leaf23]